MVTKNFYLFWILLLVLVPDHAKAQTALDGQTVGPDGVIVDEATGETTTIIDPTSFPPQPPQRGGAARATPSAKPVLSDHIPARPLSGGIPAKAMKPAAPSVPVTPPVVTAPSVRTPVVPSVETPVVKVPTVASPSAPSVAAPTVTAPASEGEIVDIPSRRIISEPLPQTDGDAPPQPSLAEPQKNIPPAPRVYDPITGRDITDDQKAENAPAIGNRFKKVPSIREQAQAPAPETATARRYPIVDAMTGKELNKPKDAPPLRTPVFDAITGRELNAPKDAPVYKSPVYDAVSGKQLNADQNKKNGIQPYVPIKRDAVTGERVDRNAPPVSSTQKKESLRDRVRDKLKE